MWRARRAHPITIDMAARTLQSTYVCRRTVVYLHATTARRAFSEICRTFWAPLLKVASQEAVRTAIEGNLSRLTFGADALQTETRMSLQ